MHTSTKFAVAVSLTTLFAIALISSIVAQRQEQSAYNMPLAFLSKTGNECTVVVQGPIGEGTTEPAPGNYTLHAGESFTITAKPANSEFDLWIISSLILDEDAIVGNGLSNTYSSAKSTTIITQEGYTYYLQPVFKPVPNQSDSEQHVSTPAAMAIAFLVVFAIGEGTVLSIWYAKREKS